MLKSDRTSAGASASALMRCGVAVAPTDFMSAVFSQKWQRVAPPSGNASSSGRPLRQRTSAMEQRSTKEQPSPALPGMGGRPASAKGMRGSLILGMDVRSPLA